MLRRSELAMKNGKMHISASSAGRDRQGSGYIYGIAFMIPFAILCAAFALLGVYPFGDRQVLVIDAWNQYYPFMLELNRKLRDGESLLYCWRIGTGEDFVSLAAYYLASPLNFLVALFPPALLRECFLLLILIKVGLSGMFCAFALNRMNGRKDFGVTVFSTFYALCGWTIGYYWNIMWLDTFAVFPLVVLGVLLLVREKRCKLYTAALAIAVCANFYMGFIVCFFVAVFFFVQCFIQRNKRREFLTNLRNIILFSVIALGMSAVVIVPVIVALQNAYKSQGSFGDSLLARGWAETLSNLFAYMEPARMGGRPYLYSGILCVVFSVAFCRLSEVSRRERLSYAMTVLFVFASANINILDYLWHGLHAAQALPYRFTFIFSFLLVMLAYRTYCSMTQLKRKDCLIVCAVCAVLCFFAALGYAQGDEGAGDGGGLFLTKNLLVGGAYLIIMALAAGKRIGRRTALLALAFAAGLELVPTVLAGTQAIGTTDRSGYPDRYEAVEEVLHGLASEEEGGFYRTELTSRYSWNDSALYGYNGVCAFSSLINVKSARLFEELGLIARQAGNKQCYQNSTPVNNMFLGLKYLISRGEEVCNQEYLTLAAQSGDVYVYRNQAYLPIGFMVREELADYRFEGNTPFEIQNNLVKAATGMEEDVFRPLDIIHVGHKNLYVTRSEYGMYRYRPLDDADKSLQGKSQEGMFRFNYEMPEDGCVYAFVDLSSESRKDSVVRVDSKDVSRSYDVYNLGSFFPAGTYEAGDIFSVCSQVGEGRSGRMRIFVGLLDQDVFDRACQALGDETLCVTEFTSRSLKGTVDVKADGLMYTSVPYERGWRVYVDGEKADIDLIFDTYMGVRLPEGEHTVEFLYSPDHIYLAAFISLLGIGIYLAVNHRTVKRNKAVCAKGGIGNG